MNLYKRSAYNFHLNLFQSKRPFKSIERYNRNTMRFVSISGGQKIANERFLVLKIRIRKMTMKHVQDNQNFFDKVRIDLHSWPSMTSFRLQYFHLQYTK